MWKKIKNFFNGAIDWITRNKKRIEACLNFANDWNKSYAC